MMLFEYRDLRQYKYQLTKEYRYQIDPIRTLFDIGAGNDFVYLEGGALVIAEGYAWDGPSGPTIDTTTFMRGSLVHDALYQLLREESLPLESLHAARLHADRLLREICRADGMSAFRAWYVYWAVRYFGWQFSKNCVTDLKMYIWYDEFDT